MQTCDPCSKLTSLKITHINKLAYFINRGILQHGQNFKM